MASPPHHLDPELVVLRVDPHQRPVGQIPRQDFIRQRVLQSLLYHPLEGPRPVDRVVPLLHQQLLEHLAQVAVVGAVLKPQRAAIV